MQVHGGCKTLVSLDRPVPLSWSYAYMRNGSTIMKALLDARGQRINKERLPDRYDNSWFGEPGSVEKARQRCGMIESCLLV